MIADALLWISPPPMSQRLELNFEFANFARWCRGRPRCLEPAWVFLRLLRFPPTVRRHAQRGLGELAALYFPLTFTVGVKGECVPLKSGPPRVNPAPRPGQLGQTP